MTLYSICYTYNLYTICIDRCTLHICNIHAWYISATYTVYVILSTPCINLSLHHIYCYTMYIVLYTVPTVPTSNFMDVLGK